MNRPALILLAVLVLVTVASVFIFVRPLLKTPPAEPPEPTVPAALPYEAVMEKTLAGYNGHHATALFADFSKSAVPAPSEAVHRELFERYYHDAFGECLSRRLSLSESEILPDRALLVWDATFSNTKLAKLSANFLMEDGRPKIVQLRFEKVESAQ